MKTVVRLPGQEIPAEYMKVRFQTLREPLGFEKGSEELPGDGQAMIVWVEEDGKIAAVGRSHLIAENEDGSVLDEKAKSACPSFEPLCSGYSPIKDDTGIDISGQFRPAIQVRGMGTLSAYRGRGLASEVLKSLEKESVKLWNIRTGWLQARLEAIPFYIANGWTCYGPEYIVPRVGPHRSMWKKF